MALCLPRTASFHNYGHFGGRNFVSCGIPSPAASSSTRQRRESARSQAIFPRRHCERSQATFRERHCERSEATKGFREITDVAGQRLAIKRGFPASWVASLTLAMTASGGYLFALAMTASGGGFLAFAFAIMGGEATDEVAR